MSQSAIIIPARYNSSRLPGKMLLPLGGKPIVLHAVDRAREANIGAVYVATDSEKIYQSVKGEVDVLFTGEHNSGTSRVAEAARQVSADFIINVQGDEPTIEPTIIQALNKSLQQGFEWVSAASPIKSIEDMNNPNVVKIVCDAQGRALYFSRSSIPACRDSSQPNISRGLQHIGIYGYHRNFLLNWENLPHSYLEEMESLEQLRAMSEGHRPKIIKTEVVAKGIDTEADYQEAKKHYNNTP